MKQLKDSLEKRIRGLAEKNQTNADVLQQILGRWEKWYPLHVVYLPPLVNDDLFGAMHWTNSVIIDLHNDG
jgi:hypothetical protein